MCVMFTRQNVVYASKLRVPARSNAQTTVPSCHETKAHFPVRIAARTLGSFHERFCVLGVYVCSLGMWRVRELIRPQHD